MIFTLLITFTFQPNCFVSAKKDAHSAVIEEVTTKQLERLLNEKDFVAVYWCKKINFFVLVVVSVFKYNFFFFGTVLQSV